jgi:Ni,Fe-hydrogenase III large subunit/Ni,Fe-hydrogenase III component G
MAMPYPAAQDCVGALVLSALSGKKWKGHVGVRLDPEARVCHLECRSPELTQVCQWLSHDLQFSFATLVADQATSATFTLTYVFYKDEQTPWVHVEFRLDAGSTTAPSIVGLTNGPSADWHEREIEDLFGLTFEGHPRLGEFILHEDWPEGINPMLHNFDAQRPFEERHPEARWDPPTVVSASGSFAMPVGPIFSDFAESAHFLLETVGEDVIRTIPRFFYKYRGVEKIAEGQKADRVLLLAERFSGIAAFAHGLAFCQAVETICHVEVPARALALRTFFAELERLRSHTAAITGICNSTALAVATSQAALIEEDLLRLSGEICQHRYLFGLLSPGGLLYDLTNDQCLHVASTVGWIAERLRDLHQMLRYSSSFLDRLEEVGIVTYERARTYGLVGPIARASGAAHDMRKLFPYANYSHVDFAVPVEREGDGYARLRVLFREAEQSATIVRDVLLTPPQGPVSSPPFDWRAGTALSAVEAPLGAAFHWLKLDQEGTVLRYRVTPPSFTNWHGFHLAAENFAFQDFPIILASFGLSNAECDR